MSRWLEPLIKSLAERAEPVWWFFRDDDAGWDDARLMALVGVFGVANGLVDLAAIPAAVSPELGRRLSRLVDEGCVSVHQHGWAHVNHERHGRKCEFGPSRSRVAQRRDLIRGRDLLAARLDGRVEPVFTPPWNRCTDETAGVIVQLGFRALSADCSGPRRGVPGLTEVPVCVDWTRSWSQGGDHAVGAQLRDAVHRLTETCAAPAVGVMLHHAVMRAEELAALRELLALLDVASMAVVSSIGALMGEKTFTLVSSTGHGWGSR